MLPPLDEAKPSSRDGEIALLLGLLGLFICLASPFAIFYAIRALEREGGVEEIDRPKAVVGAALGLVGLLWQSSCVLFALFVWLTQGV